MSMSMTLEKFNITSTFRLSLEFTFGLVGISTLAFGGLVLEATKDLSQIIPSLFRFGFQDDEKPKLNVDLICPFLSCLSTFVAM